MEECPDPAYFESWVGEGTWCQAYFARLGEESSEQAAHRYPACFERAIVQMPAGIAVGTLAIGPAGATNAAIMAAQILGLTRPEIAKNVADFRAAQEPPAAPCRAWPLCSWAVGSAT
mgnify:CR=1 FL=1